MPPLPSVPGVCRVVLSGTFGSARWVNVLHVQYSGAPLSNAEAAALGAAVAAAFGTRIMPRTSTGYVLTAWECTDLSSPTAGRGQGTVSIAGALATANLPANAAWAISWRIQRRYRGGHPRTYIGGLTTEQLSTVTLLTAAVAAGHTTAAENFRTDVNLLTTNGRAHTLGQVSYYQGKNADGSPKLRTTPIFEAFSGSTVGVRIDSQRRRLGKGR